MKNRSKVLVFDIETYGGFKAHMTEVSAFGYSWYGTEKATVLSGLDFPETFKAKRGFNDRPLMAELSKRWNESEAVIAHYGERFDRRFLNTRIEHWNLPPLKPVPLIDTWRISRDNFALPSNSLDSLLKFFECPYQKVPLTWPEWRGVQTGHRPDLRKLNDHCEADVLGTEWVVRNHLYKYSGKFPNQNVGSAVVSCNYCGSARLQSRGTDRTQRGEIRRFKCMDCLKWLSQPLKGGVTR